MPPELNQLVSSMIARVPAARPTCAEVVVALEPLIDQLPRKMTLGRRGAQAI
ncbi:MAG TPA: hypothetical protein VEY96_08215 [Actinomycetes bacterium]|nr:hypothetical protein [Actinomycetes bacterium]